MSKYTLFLDVMARDNPLDGGMDIRKLNSETIDGARAEAKAIVDEEYPEGDCDYAVAGYAIAECVSLEKVDLIQ
jgi:hypothetical protein